MKSKVEIAINIVIILLTLGLTIAYAVDGNIFIAVMFGIIMLLNCVMLFLRIKNSK